jgi:hypothetical protein
MGPGAGCGAKDAAFLGDDEDVPWMEAGPERDHAQPQGVTRDGPETRIGANGTESQTTSRSSEEISSDA